LDEQLVRSNQRQVPRNQQLCGLSGRRGSLEQTLFQDSELLGDLEELLVQEVKHPFFDNQTLYLVTKALFLETGRVSLESKRLPLDGKMLRR
jgi:hypothetical protein